MHLRQVIFFLPVTENLMAHEFSKGIVAGEGKKYDKHRGVIQY